LRKRAPRGAIRLATLAAAATQGQVLCRSPQGAHTHRCAERCTRCCEWPNCRPARTHGRHRWQRTSAPAGAGPSPLPRPGGSSCGPVTSNASGHLWRGQLLYIVVGRASSTAFYVSGGPTYIGNGDYEIHYLPTVGATIVSSPGAVGGIGARFKLPGTTFTLRAWRTLSASRGSPAMTDVPGGLARSYRTTSFSRPGCPCPSWAAARLVRPTEQRATVLWDNIPWNVVAIGG
jgi:hypothetical protein